ncbi:MAG: class I SAM-dependent methyltransferase [Bacteroidia bacterium]|nr:class I SAM-dependent methyltransferase [Bacteroidia bacterium]
MTVFRKVYRYLRHETLEDTKKARDFRSARRLLLSSPDLTHKEKILLKKISLQVHDRDSMYMEGKAFHYLCVGLSASRCIQEALHSAGKEFANGSILDFPSGSGRVLRFLQARFPNSDITAAEIDISDLDFCHRNFSATPLLSKIPLSDLNLPKRFDLIWCGSLLTHIDEQAANDLLQFFHDHLSDRGLCIFTTHGKGSVERIQSKTNIYGLSEEAQQKVIRDYKSKGYGYVDYPNESGYGISIVTHQRICEIARGFARWDETMFLQRGWDNHQDVYAFAIQRPSNGMQATSCSTS